MQIRRTVVTGVIGTLALAAATLSLSATAADAASSRACASPSQSKPGRAADVAKVNKSAFRAAQTRNAGRLQNFDKVARSDRKLWLDRCGAAYFVEETASAPERSAAAQSMATSKPLAGVPLTDTFTLESKPGSSKTIYLDVRGGTVTGTAWNSSYGSTITLEPYSIDATVDTNYSDAELTEIQKMWQVVSEDYAAFDVNVTTKNPGAAAIDRTSSADTVYGTRALITNGGSVYDACGCGGVAYVGVFNLTGTNHGYYQPAFVFSNGTTKNGKYVGEATAHEVGHNFGLSHDGTASAGYYSGSAPWAPIMGASYSQPVSQWSRGEYPGANNTEDDLALIATGAPVRPDEDAAGPLALTAGAPANGIVTSAADVDRYTVTAAGPTTVQVDPATFADLDVQLQVVDSTGTQVALVNPTTTRVSATEAGGMNAGAAFTAPSAGATYTALIRGSGQGDPAAAGGYSSYASIGTYQVSLATGTPGTGTPLALTVPSLPNGVVGTAYSATGPSASGGTAPYSYSATGLPAGLSLNAATGAVTGTPSAAGSSTPVFTVTDGLGVTASRSGSITVNPAGVPAVTVANQAVSATVGTALSRQVTASGGNGTFSWAVSSGSVPPGLGLTSGGLLSGTPMTAGTFTFGATASSGGTSGTGTVTVTVAAAPVVAPLAFSTGSTLPSGKRSTTYSTQIRTTGGTPAYSWAWTGGSIPSGMSLSASGGTATLSGRPSSTGTYSFTLRITDAKGKTASRTFTIQVVR